jgi:hypothetical protein
MFSIKLVHPQHFIGGYPFFSDDYDGTDGRKTLMNFSKESRHYADKIRFGDKAIVYVTQATEEVLEIAPQAAVWSQKFVRAIEYIGSVKDGTAAAHAHGSPIQWLSEKWGKVFLPIRFLAKADPAKCPDYRMILEQACVNFEPQHVPMVSITEEEYGKLYEAIDWEWKV